jgi:Protein of unknown function (DUF1553)/Protein of unknown function (DUF1549)/Planctomycete cytochrome C
MKSKLLWVMGGIAAVLLFSSFFGWNPFQTTVDYNLEVKPILNKHCIACHGGVKQASGVSFLFEEEMYRPAKSGKIPVIAGDADGSEMMRRILSHDPEEKMPKDGPPLTQAEIETLKNWIDQGAEWGRHWAYNRIESPSVPSMGGFWGWLGLGDDEQSRWAKNEIDHFVLEKLNQNQLKPNAEADKATLIRRASLDLTGLAPTDDQVQKFLNDKSENAYETLIDSLLASPSYGERWAALWLDLARYSDTKGYERDPGRKIWRYRDWLIKSFNADKPFDQFTMEQIAGDLMQGKNGEPPTDEQLIATGFHRNTMNNDEGGTVDEEFRTAAIIDRVNTTWDVWHGTTFGCVQCHSHPYDPIRHDEYYKYLAFFNNTRDEDVTSDTPTLRFYKSEDSLYIKKIDAWLTKYKASHKQKQDVGQFLRIIEPKFNSHDLDGYHKASLLDAKYLGIKDSGYARLKNVTLTNKNRLLIALGSGAANAVLRIRLRHARGPVIASVPVPMGNSDSVKIVPMLPVEGKHHLFFTVENNGESGRWIQIKWVAFQEALAGSNQQGFNCIEENYAHLLTIRPDATPIFVEGTNDLARTTQVFERGNWLVKGKKVTADVPQSLLEMPEEFPKNRLGLAQWMTDRNNPLTARVIVNRLWEQLFGTGIVETVEDFGSQGIAPTHQELLDWMAVELMEEYDWSIKKLLKKIVMSSTYRQSSALVDKDVRLQIDPYNRLLSRGPRVRLSAEQVRDQALIVSGLLSRKMYGSSVMPPQPEGIWLSPYSGDVWTLSKGEDRYRRGIYTYWKRTAPYPSMVAFDAPSREFCQSRRIRTNTPLQALVTLNDPVYLEAAHCLADRMAQKPNPAQQIGEGYRLLVHKSLPPRRLAVLLRLYQKTLSEYQKDPESIQKLLAFGGDKSPQKAALTVTANVLLNLDEVVTKE